MRLARNLRLPLALVVLAAGWANPKPDESPSTQALKAKGLAKAGTTFTIEDEKPVLAHMKEARSTFAAYAAMSDQQAKYQELAHQASQLEDQRVQIQSQLDELNLQIGDNGASTMSQGPPSGGGPGGGAGPGGMLGRSVVSPLTIRRNELRVLLNQVMAEQNKVKNQAPQAKDAEALEARVKSADEKFRNTLADLRKAVDEVKKKYVDLAEDAAIKTALADARKANPRLHLGPSDAFTAVVKELEQAERRFLGKRTTTVSKKKAKAKK